MELKTEAHRRTPSARKKINFDLLSDQHPPGQKLLQVRSPTNTEKPATGALGLMDQVTGKVLDRETVPKMQGRRLFQRSVTKIQDISMFDRAINPKADIHHHGRPSKPLLLSPGQLLSPSQISRASSKRHTVKIVSPNSRTPSTAMTGHVSFMSSQKPSGAGADSKFGRAIKRVSGATRMKTFVAKKPGKDLQSLVTTTSRQGTVTDKPKKQIEVQNKNLIDKAKKSGSPKKEQEISQMFEGTKKKFTLPKEQKLIRATLQERVFDTVPSWRNIARGPNFQVSRLKPEITAHWAAYSRLKLDADELAQEGRFGKYEEGLEIRVIDEYNWTYHGQAKKIPAVFTYGGYTEEELNGEVLSWRSIERPSPLQTHKPDQFARDPGHIPHGLGRLVYAGLNCQWLYEGYFKDGKPEGYCRWIWDDGLCYKGYVKDYMCEGPGEQCFGESYGQMVQNGRWKKNVLHAGQTYPNATKVALDKLGAALKKQCEEANREDASEEDEAGDARDRLRKSVGNYSKMRQLFGLKRTSRKLGSQLLDDHKERRLQRSQSIALTDASLLRNIPDELKRQVEHLKLLHRRQSLLKTRAAVDDGLKQRFLRRTQTRI